MAEAPTGLCRGRSRWMKQKLEVVPQSLLTKLLTILLSSARFCGPLDRLTTFLVIKCSLFYHYLASTIDNLAGELSMTSLDDFEAYLTDRRLVQKKQLPYFLRWGKSGVRSAFRTFIHGYTGKTGGIKEGHLPYFRWRQLLPVRVGGAGSAIDRNRNLRLVKRVFWLSCPR